MFGIHRIKGMRIAMGRNFTLFLVSVLMKSSTKVKRKSRQKKISTGSFFRFHRHCYDYIYWMFLRVDLKWQPEEISGCFWLISLRYKWAWKGKGHFARKLFLQNRKVSPLRWVVTSIIIIFFTPYVRLCLNVLLIENQ